MNVSVIAGFLCIFAVQRESFNNDLEYKKYSNR